LRSAEVNGTRPASSLLIENTGLAGGSKSSRRGADHTVWAAERTLRVYFLPVRFYIAATATDRQESVLLEALRYTVFEELGRRCAAREFR
jgi:hypothetical protein